MNRSVLLVICDFLILTMLTFVQFDPSPAEAVAVAAVPDPGEGAVSAPAMSNIVWTLREALEHEARERQALTNALTQTRSELEGRLRLLAEREQSLTNVQGRLETSEAEARRLAEERRQLEQAQAAAAASSRDLQGKLEATREGTEALQDRLSDSVREATEARTRLTLLEVEVARRRSEAEEMQRRIADLDTAQSRLRDEKQQLTVELRQTEVEARVARREVTNLTQRLTTVGQEKAQLVQATTVLATNVGTLSQESTALREEVRRQVRLPANTIYADFVTNRVGSEFSGTTRGGLGQTVTRRREGATVLVRLAGRVCAVLHLESTPLRLWPTNAPWGDFAVELRRGETRVRVDEFALLRRDPRVALITVPERAVEALGARVYEPAADPAKFAEAVLIGGEETYYGETAFRLSPVADGYVQMERSTFRRMLGDFSPRRGDLALTPTGQLLGLMVTGEQCLLLRDLEALPAFRCGPGTDPAANAAIMRSAQAAFERLPSALR